MVSVVSALRTFVLLGFGFLAGGIVGGYAVSVVYGDRAPTTPPPQSAPCPACPVCPPQRPTEDPGRPPQEQALEEEEVEEPEEIEVPPEAIRPGLPASAVKLASAGFQRESAICIDQAGGASGSLLLDLTVTATSGIGHIRELAVIKRTGEVAALETCLGEAAKRVQFEWQSGEGESKLRYPVQVGAH